MLNTVADKVYDAAICTFSVIDIVCDVCVTLQFYTNGHMMFFWISIFILSLAQISYAVLTCLALEPIVEADQMKKDDNKTMWMRWSQKTKKCIVLFFCVLPFGQLVPLVLMVANAYPLQRDKICDYLGFICHFSPIAQPSLGDDEEESDPLSLYIRRKTMSHLGFIIEAIIEAIPQRLSLYAIAKQENNFSTIQYFANGFFDFIRIKLRERLLSQLNFHFNVNDCRNIQRHNFVLFHLSKCGNF